MKVVIVKEDDGLPTLDVYVAGTLVGTISYPLGASSRDPETIDLGVFSIANGDEIKLEGWLEGGAAARVDKIIFEAEPSGTNRPPSISSVSAVPIPAEVAEQITFSCSATDPDGDGLTYSWDFDDGTPLGSGASVQHSYVSSGAYTVTVTVDDGSLVDTDTVAVTVNAPDTIVIECEDMNLDGYVGEGTGDFLYIATYAEGTATAQFPGGTASYRIRVNIIKENDGYPTLNVYVRGQLVGTINYPLGASQRDPETVDLGVFNIAAGDDILIAGIREGDAAARVDSITFEYAGAWDGDTAPPSFHGAGGGCGASNALDPLAVIGLLAALFEVVRRLRRKDVR